jgi:hypothetical protein
MFAKKTQAEVLGLDRHGHGTVIDRDIYGVDWEHRVYILEVRPPGEQPFRVGTKAKVPIFSKPEEGNVVKVRYDPRNHKTEIEIEGDPRYDPALARLASEQQATAEGGPRAGHADAERCSAMELPPSTTMYCPVM